MTQLPPIGEASDQESTGAVALYVRLWAHEGRDADLTAYEDAVLALLPEHGARVVGRARSTGAEGAPLEVQLLEFPSEASLDGFMHDERRVALADVRDAVVGRTELLRVELVR